MSAKDDQMKTMENSYTECMKALKDKEEADKKEKETWKKELEEKLGIVQKEWEEKSERNGVALQEQCKEANEKLRKMEEQLMKMMEELKVTKEQHEKEKKEMEGQMNKMMEAMMKAERDQAEKDRAKKIQDEKDRAKKDQDGKDQAKKDQDGKDRAKKDQDGKYRAENDRAKKDQAEKDQAEKDRAKKDQDEKMMMKDLEPGALARRMGESSEEGTLQSGKLQPHHVEAAADLLSAKISFRSCPCCKYGVSQSKAINTSEIFDLLCPSCYSMMKKLSSAQIMEVCKYCPWCGHTASQRRPTKTVGIPELLCSDCLTLMEKLRSGRTMDISDLLCSACPLLPPIPGQEIKMTPKPPSEPKPTTMGERVAKLHNAKKLTTGRGTDAQIYKTTTSESPSIIAPLMTKPSIIASLMSKPSIITPLKTKPSIITPLKTKPSIIASLKTKLQPLPKQKATKSVTPTPKDLRRRSELLPQISLKKGNTNPGTRR
ncbi:titin homolog isoform X2 [Rana temporaria]|nr:titin homolog isoform X2 [Rana temporaria]XP_040177450.1 titin homolog isoform X2 [Rana temporaria]